MPFRIRGFKQKTIEAAHRYPTRLPPEVWLQIMEHLPLGSQASFAISCKFFKSLCSNSLESFRAHADNTERLNFLRSMQYALPQKWWCPSCLRYHQRHSSNDMNGYQYKGCQLGSSKLVLWYPEHGTNRRLIFEWRQLHLVMRSYCLSRKHGNSPERMERNDEISFNGARAWVAITARVTFDHRLILGVFTYIPTDWKRASGLGREEVNSFTSLVACEHQRKSRVLLQAAGEKIGQMFDEFNRHTDIRTRTRALSTSPYYRCRYCPSEYHISTMHHKQPHEDDQWAKAHSLDKSRRFVVTFAWLMDLGPCKRPDEPEWAAISGANQRAVFSTPVYDHPGGLRGCIIYQYWDIGRIAHRVHYPIPIF